jgi:hypothetical protein
MQNSVRESKMMKSHSGSGSGSGSTSSSTSTSDSTSSSTSTSASTSSSGSISGSNSHESTNKTKQKKKAKKKSLTDELKLVRQQLEERDALIASLQQKELQLGAYKVEMRERFQLSKAILNSLYCNRLQFKRGNWSQPQIGGSTVRKFFEGMCGGTPSFNDSDLDVIVDSHTSNKEETKNFLIAYTSGLAIKLRQEEVYLDKFLVKSISDVIFDPISDENYCYGKKLLCRIPHYHIDVYSLDQKGTHTIDLLGWEPEDENYPHGDFDVNMFRLSRHGFKFNHKRNTSLFLDTLQNVIDGDAMIMQDMHKLDLYTGTDHTLWFVANRLAKILPEYSIFAGCGPIECNSNLFDFKIERKEDCPIMALKPPYIALKVNCRCTIDRWYSIMALLGMAKNKKCAYCNGEYEINTVERECRRLKIFPLVTAVTDLSADCKNLLNFFGQVPKRRRREDYKLSRISEEVFSPENLVEFSRLLTKYHAPSIIDPQQTEDDHQLAQNLQQIDQDHQLAQSLQQIEGNHPLVQDQAYDNPYDNSYEDSHPEIEEVE